MVRSLLSLVIALALALPAAAQHANVGSVAGGGTTALAADSTDLTGCTDGWVLYAKTNKLRCNAGLIYADSTQILTMLGGATVGSTTTQGTGTTLIRGTISGTSATSNFLNVTGTLNTSLTGTNSGLYASISSGGGTLTTQTAFTLIGPANASGSGNAISLAVSGQGTNGNSFTAIQGSAMNGNVAYGVVGNGNSSGTFTAGVYGTGGGSSGTTNTVGVLAGRGSNASAWALYAGPTGTFPSGTNGIIGGDNGSAAVSILTLKDNASTVFDVANDGATTVGPVAGTIVPLTVNNGPSTGNILNVQDNGSNVLTVADGGVTNVNSNGSAAAPSFRVGTTTTAQVQLYSDGTSRGCFGKNNTFAGCIESSTTVNGLAWRSDSYLGFFNGTTDGAGFDTLMGRFSSGVFKFGSSPSAIKFLAGGGAAVASAAALPLPTGNVFHVTGTTNITSITATNLASGVEITLIFDGILTFTNGNNIKIGTDFITTADDVIKLAYDGTNFYESARKVN